jgi:mannose-6-phosphate isomerase-like protein (cupin superfamily)
MKIAIALLLGVVAAAQAPAPASPVAPATYFRDADLMSTLKGAAKAAPEMHTAPVHNSDHYRINMVERDAPTGATAHPGFIEVHHIVRGSGTLVTGGTMVRAANAGRGGAGSTIDGGVSRHVAAGDVILIPAGSPHWYKELDGPITYLELRFEEVKK